MNARTTVNSAGRGNTNFLAPLPKDSTQRDTRTRPSTFGAALDSQTVLGSNIPHLLRAQKKAP
ncbi:MAG: hypothetical protein ACKVK0_12035, partial [Pirellulales bacterium]